MQIAVPTDFKIKLTSLPPSHGHVCTVLLLVFPDTPRQSQSHPPLSPPLTATTDLRLPSVTVVRLGFGNSGRINEDDDVVEVTRVPWSPPPPTPTPSPARSEEI